MLRLQRGMYARPRIIDQKKNLDANKWYPIVGTASAPSGDAGDMTDYLVLINDGGTLTKVYPTKVTVCVTKPMDTKQ